MSSGTASTHPGERDLAAPQRDHEADRGATAATVAAPLAGERHGGGEPLLLLHGIGATRTDFTALLPALARSFDVLAVDLPGHGGSPPLPGWQTVGALADAVERDLDARGLGRVHVLGNSLGGRIGLELARRGRARSLVALSPSGLGTPPERLFQASLLGGARLLLRAMRPALPFIARTRLGRTALLAPLRAQPWKSTEAEGLGLKDGLADAERFWDMLFWCALADVPTGLGEIDCPVTLGQGFQDGVAPLQAPRYLALVPGARFRALMFAGHAPQSDRPEEIVGMVLATARRATGGRRDGAATG